MEEIQFNSMELPFFSVHNHTEISNFRFSDSIIRVEQLIDRAVELGYKGVAITDHEAISGHMRFLEHYKELNQQNKLPEGFKIALGNEIYLVNSLEEVKDHYVSGVTKYWHFILLAKDRIGYDQLKAISAQSAWENYFRQANQERVPTVKSELEAIIGENKGHLIASTACMGGELPYLAMEYFRASETDAPVYKRKIHEFISWCIHIFGKENFYIELQPSANGGTEQSKMQAFSNQCLLKIAKAYGLKCIVTTDSHYLKAEDRSIHEAYLSADDSMGGSREAGDFYETTYMCDKAELHAMLCNHMGEDDAATAFQNTMSIWEDIEEYDLSHPVIVPSDPHEPVFTLQHIFKDWYHQYEYINKFAHSDNIQERYFLALCEEGFLNKNEEFNETNMARIDVELGELWEISVKLGQRIASYYTLVRTIIHEIMWKVSYVGIARGSVTGFYTAYLSGITQVNPIVYNLPHWRHISAGRPSDQ